MFFVWRCATARTPSLTGFWAWSRTATGGMAHRMTKMLPSVAFISMFSRKGHWDAPFCTATGLASRPAPEGGNGVQRRRGLGSLPRLFSTPPFHAVLDYVTCERLCMRSVVRAVLLCASVASVAPLSLAVAQSNEERVANDVY